MPKFAANLNFLFTELAFIDRFDAAAAAGFTAVEATNPYLARPEDIARRLASNGLTMALINTPAGSEQRGERGLAGLPGREEEFGKALGTALKYADATGCRSLHVLAGLLHQGARRATYVANLRSAARTAAASGVAVLIEPINRLDIPGYLLATTEEARAVIYEVGEPNIGLQFDLYHRQVAQGGVASAIAEFAPLTRHYQIASPPDRGEPDAGELNYPWLFKLIDASSFAGFVGCEYRPRAGTAAGLGWAAACGVRLA
jgi:hydroxypyruvate isomerase